MQFGEFGLQVRLPQSFCFQYVVDFTLLSVHFFRELPVASVNILQRIKTQVRWTAVTRLADGSPGGVVAQNQ